MMEEFEKGNVNQEKKKKRKYRDEPYAKNSCGKLLIPVILRNKNCRSSPLIFLLNVYSSMQEVEEEM